MVVLLGRSGLGHHSEAFADVDGDTLQREYGEAGGGKETRNTLQPRRGSRSRVPTLTSTEMTATEMLSYGLSSSEAKRLAAIRDDAAEHGVIQYAFRGSRSSIV